MHWDALGLDELLCVLGCVGKACKLTRLPILSLQTPSLQNPQQLMLEIESA